MRHGDESSDTSLNSILEMFYVFSYFAGCYETKQSVPYIANEWIFSFSK